MTRIAIIVCMAVSLTEVISAAPEWSSTLHDQSSDPRWDFIDEADDAGDWEARGGQAELTPYQPPHWNDAIPIGITPLSSSAAHNYSGAFYDDQPVYFNWASSNVGAASASIYAVYVEITGYGVSQQWSALTTPAGAYTSLPTDLGIGPLSEGPHTFRLWLDYLSEIDEPDETNNYYERTINVIAVVPAATVMFAASRGSNPGGPAGACDLSLSPGVRSEPRQGRVAELRITFDRPPGGPTPGSITFQQTTCARPGYAAYAGASAVAASIAGNDLVLNFTPALENARTYRVNIGPPVTRLSGQFVEVRGLIGDVDHNGVVNSNDRAAVIATWTGPVGFSCLTDLNSTGATNGNDRSIVVGAWTGTGTHCAP